MGTNELFQYSVVSALMDGVATNGLPIRTLLSHGDHGLGTFRYMAGEMIILDGTIYQMNSDGTVRAISPDDEAPKEADDATETPSPPLPAGSPCYLASAGLPAVSPFAMVTRFRPTTTTRARLSGNGKDTLERLLTSLFPGARNTYLAMRLEGTFRSVTVRTATGQRVPGEGLREVAKNQVSHTFGVGSDNSTGGSEGPVRGTMIGFRSPTFLQGVSVAGDHLHFLAEDRMRGGHVLGFEGEGELEVQVASMWKIVLELPHDDEQFNAAKLERDAEGIAAAEG
ncbi:hypothetical protein VTK73DRAFT_4149 [Phialemonium thermophilum]|uniref:Alpha-acetolactate decarboxylase n=1 Tax=Phialemonium thermophilum TaxID=223376 RepID=A0ABR3VCQ9_9PEZI